MSSPPPSDADHHTHDQDELLEAESRWIAERRKLYRPDAKAGDRPEDLVGLALSGGGIRSATFGLGVMQALAGHGVMKRVDYLSTVSGGGYIGSSLSWLLGKYGRTGDGDDARGFGCGPDDFPLGTRDRESDYLRRKLPASGDEASPRDIVRWLRQHGQYLTPGDGLNTMAFAAVCLRGIVLSFIVYFSMITLLTLVLVKLGLLDYAGGAVTWASVPGLLRLAAYVAALLVLAAMAYSVGSRFTRKQAMDPIPGDWLRDFQRNSYNFRRFLERWAGAGFTLGIGLLVFGTVPIVYQALGDRVENAGLAGAVSTVLGMLSALGVFRGDDSKRRIPASVTATAGAALLAYGLLLLAYSVCRGLAGLPGGQVALVVLLMVLAVVVLGVVTNTNYVSIHRYYRDRLMETFMPDLPLDPDKPSEGATGANAQMIQHAANPHAPYHLINANIVLVHSKVPRFRGRGGDCFVLSKEYCGSRATGWTRSTDFMGGNLSLPSAMAVSGAAAHPNTGAGGEGVTRNYFVAFLMAFLNIRLGLWARNPEPRKGPDRVPGIIAKVSNLIAKVPNFIYPGLRELLSYQIDEKGRHVLLTDGGHFENLGIYELIRRRCKVIIACDGAADPEFSFSDLATAIERVRADFGVKINVTLEDLQPLVPRERKDDAGMWPVDPREEYALRGYVVAPIEYPSVRRSPGDGEPDVEVEPPCTGWLVYVKTTFTSAVSADLYAYRRAHPTFPDQSTADQFFDERQFEAYRELGFQTVHEMLGARNWKQKFPELDVAPQRTLFGNPELTALLDVPVPKSGSG